MEETAETVPPEQYLSQQQEPLKASLHYTSYCNIGFLIQAVEAHCFRSTDLLPKQVPFWRHQYTR